MGIIINFTKHNNNLLLVTNQISKCEETLLTETFKLVEEAIPCQLSLRTRPFNHLTDNTTKMGSSSNLNLHQTWMKSGFNTRNKSLTLKCMLGKGTCNNKFSHLCMNTLIWINLRLKMAWGQIRWCHLLHNLNSIINRYLHTIKWRCIKNLGSHRLLLCC